MNETMVSIAGNVATDLRFLRSDRGTPLASFRLASTPRRYDRYQGGWVDGHTTFVTVLCWRTLAENAAASLRKGEPVVVFGRLRVEAWEKEGRTGTTVEIEATALGHDLSRGTSAFRRTRREQGESSSDTEVAEELARSWDAQTSEAPGGSAPTAPAAGAPRPEDVGADTEEGVLPTRPGSNGHRPQPSPPTSAGSDRRAA
ncbi:single-stranded DNA-binding protein [Actinopolymorpha alba]|uniref:single-stranded DNA-binding protein n=1 Tax=Actinopolymorpha alba TaxID=533267 RepID=UPI00037CF38D|nr:single-stranded DNA-binding protein [Actinopolymorpha alba]